MKEFSWGDNVRVSSTAPEKYGPNEAGVVCGFWQTETQEVADKFGEELGTMMCTVEFSEGITTEIPTSLLRKLED